jgi:hypothetical protein
MALRYSIENEHSAVAMTTGYTSLEAAPKRWLSDKPEHWEQDRLYLCDRTVVGVERVNGCFRSTGAFPHSWCHSWNSELGFYCTCQISHLKQQICEPIFLDDLWNYKHDMQTTARCAVRIIRAWLCRSGAGPWPNGAKRAVGPRQILVAPRRMWQLFKHNFCTSNKLPRNSATLCPDVF